MAASDRFDVFLSYKREDEAWTKQLALDLESRGVRVWRDREGIRPGDEYPDALERGLRSCSALAIVVTPQSLESAWVQWEYERATNVSVGHSLRIIPLMLQDATIPARLETLQFVDFRQPDRYNQSVDQLVWPGITGHRVVFYPVDGSAPTEPWLRLYEAFHEAGLTRGPGEDIDRITWTASKNETDRLVLVVDLFDNRRNTPAEFAARIFGMRRESPFPHEAVFLLYHSADTMRRRQNELMSPELPDNTLERLHHYFFLDQDEIFDQGLFQARLHDVWLRVQRNPLHGYRSKESGLS